MSIARLAPALRRLRMPLRRPMGLRASGRVGCSWVGAVGCRRVRHFVRCRFALCLCEDESIARRCPKPPTNLMQALSAYTQDGMVFPVDARLRPQGGDGELVFSPTRLAAYFENEAQPWEALSYTKVRFVGGSRIWVS